jgi:hypothetical protein
LSCAVLIIFIKHFTPFVWFIIPGTATPRYAFLHTVPLVVRPVGGCLLVPVGPLGSTASL